MLHGREAERDRLVALIGAAAAGRAGALVVRGEAGIGKTSLVRECLAAARAAGAETAAEPALMLWTQGIESESPLAFAALHRLLRPVLAGLDQLEAAQADALRIALGQSGGHAIDRFVVFAATLSLLAGAAEQQPVVCVVDDAHWLDPASADALRFVARRLYADRVAVIFTARSGPGRFEAADLPELVLTGLDDASAYAVLLGQPGAPVAPSVIAELQAMTGGNPLALTELPRTLTAAQRAGRAPLPARLPLTGIVEAALLDRVRRLSDDAQRLLLVAAADDSQVLRVVRSAAARLGLAPAALDEAIRSELLFVSGAKISWQHPLVRSAVYSAASLDAREETHRALADVFAAAGDGDRGAWHRAAAIDGPDDQLAEALAAAAANAGRRGDHAASATMGARAAELTTEPLTRARRRLTAGWDAWLSGRTGYARALVAAGLSDTDDVEVAADLASLRARLEWNEGSADTGVHILLEASKAVADVDPARAWRMSMVASVLVTFGARAPSPGGFAQLPDPRQDPRLRCLAHLVAGHRHLAEGSWADAAHELRSADSLGVQLVDDADIQSNLALAAFHLGDDDRSEIYYRHLLASARSDSRLSLMVHALARLPSTQIPAGRWDQAAASMAEAISLASDAGQPSMLALPLAWQAVLTAARGGSAEGILAELTALRTRTPVGIAAPVTDDLVRWAHGLTAVGRRDAGSAYHHLAELALPVFQRLAAVDRLEAAVTAGQHEVAVRWIEELDQFGRATETAWARAAAELGRALLAGPTDAEGHFREALGWTAGGQRPVDRARIQLAYGVFLRRSGRRVDARVQLKAALPVFDDIGANAAAGRAREELRASGESTRRSGLEANPLNAHPLTAQEQQTANLVGQGLATRQIAAQLFLSPRTVEYHLSHVYRKLGVSTRAELARLLGPL